MPSGSLIQRYEALEERRAELAAAHAPRSEPTPVHAAVVELLKRLLTLGQLYSSEAVPLPLRVMMRTLDQMTGTLVEEFAQVPPDRIVIFFRGLRDELDAVIRAAEAMPALPPGGDPQT